MKKINNMSVGGAMMWIFIIFPVIIAILYFIVLKRNKQTNE